jgi:hypothetical protein
MVGLGFFVRKPLTLRYFREIISQAVIQFLYMVGLGDWQGASDKAKSNIWRNS